MKIEKDMGLDIRTYMVDEDPKTFGEAMNRRDSHLWQQAIDEEIKSISENNK